MLWEAQGCLPGTDRAAAPQPVQPSSQRGKAATAFVNVDNTARGRCRREETSHGSPGCQQRRVGASGWELLGEQRPEARAKPTPRRGGTSTPPRPSPQGLTLQRTSGGGFADFLLLHHGCAMRPGRGPHFNAAAWPSAV